MNNSAPQRPSPALRFSRQARSASYLAPGPGGKLHPVTVKVELRRDPLTRHSGRLAHFQGFRLQPPDLAPSVRQSREGCPFCPERIELVTPHLPARIAASGRIQVGEAVLFPNLSPYDRHSVVVVLTRDHFLRPEEFRAHHLADGLTALIEYFSHLEPVARGTSSVVTWNYMPPAGATQVHAHLQGFSTDRPGALLEQELRCSRAFHRRTGRSFWNLLVAEEERLGERFLARAAHSAWLTPFVSRSVVSDIMVVFPECRRLAELGAPAIAEFARGICASLAFLSAEGVAAFNLAFYSEPAGERQDHFRLHARLSPRIYFNPSIQGSDTTAWHHLLDEPFMVRSPEALAQQLQPQLRAALAGA
ncbi:MAG: hypothetical protein ACYCUD_05245 [Candidatus Dormibacteria bacterium]